MNYNALAPLYDRIMCHVKYERWLALIQKIASVYFAHCKPTILEFGGGSGVLAKMLTENGFPYYGSDYSYEMCKEAKKKGISFFCADALKVPLKETFPFVIFLYDGINYLKTLDDYKRLFNEIYPYLDTSGFFLFDITTETNSLKNFIDHIDSEDFGESSYIRHSYYNKENKTQYNDFTIYTKHPGNNSLYKKECEYHAQKIFSVEEVLSVVPDNHFSLSGVWDNFSFDKYNSRSERIHFLLKKK